mmetsp:Transcript_16906/g.46665  ORF Transcript_16906/g.46665 Transcript_16906/m.46665 type:complete len:127 (+) Transcript_16906:857-1237(+)
MRDAVLTGAEAVASIGSHMSGALTSAADDSLLLLSWWLMRRISQEELLWQPSKCPPHSAVCDYFEGTPPLSRACWEWCMNKTKQKKQQLGGIKKARFPKCSGADTLQACQSQHSPFSHNVDLLHEP